MFTSPESKRIRATLVNDRQSLDIPITVQRQEWEAGAAQVTLPSEITILPVDAAGLYGEWITTPNTAPEQVLYFLHGGGFSAGSCVTHREMAARLCLASGQRVLVIDYRLAPEHPFPAAVEDAGQGYQWLLDSGIAPEQIVIGGDSAGGGLAMSTLLWLRDRDVALPGAAVLISPWFDLALTGPSLATRAEVDPLCSIEGLRLAASYYLGSANPKTPLASPLYGDLHGLPPMLIQVGDHELLLSDSTRLAEKAQASGVDVSLEIWNEMWHVWHGWAGSLPEGQQAIDRIGAFIQQRLTQTTGIVL
jgi:monoterpene epsilon-lactone hydrolase